MAQATDTVHPARVDALSRKVETIREELTDEIDDLREENDELRKEIGTLKNKLEVIGADGIVPNTPDKRALKIRKTLYEKANKGKNPRPTAAMDKDDVENIMPGLSREQRYEAMRRAAGGNDLAKKGTSSLSPIQGIEWDTSNDRNNRVVIDLETVEERLGRKIIKTDEGDYTE